jgi:hypothetical protein
MARTVSRAVVFEDFLANMIGAMGAGLSQSGQRGAQGRGFGAAINYPYQQQARLQALQAQQAQIEQEQARTQQTEAQTALLSSSIPLTAPNGQTFYVPASVAAQYLRGGAAAQIGAQGRVEAAQIGAQAKMDVEKMHLQVLQGGISKFVPDLDSSGQPIYRLFNKFGQEVGRTEVKFLPQLITKSSSTVEYKDDGNGNILALPKTTTTTPIVGGRAAGPVSTPGATPSGFPSATPSGFPRRGGQVVAPGKPVSMVVGTDKRGMQVAGTPDELRTAGVSQYVKLDGAEAAKVNTARQLTSPGGLFNLIDQDLSRFKPGELPGLGPRWNEFLAGTVGTADPRYVALRTHVNGLLSTALMQAHVGARGGERLMEHFEDIANAGKMSLPTLRAALGAERQYVEEKAMRPLAGGAAGGARRIIDLTQ